MEDNLDLQNNSEEEIESAPTRKDIYSEFQEEIDMLNNEISESEDFYIKLKDLFNSGLNSRSSGGTGMSLKTAELMINLKNNKLSYIKEKANTKKLVHELSIKHFNANKKEETGGMTNEQLYKYLSQNATNSPQDINASVNEEEENSIDDKLDDILNKLKQDGKISDVELENDSNDMIRKMNGGSSNELDNQIDSFKELLDSNKIKDEKPVEENLTIEDDLFENEYEEVDLDNSEFRLVVTTAGAIFVLNDNNEVQNDFDTSEFKIRFDRVDDELKAILTDTGEFVEIIEHSLVKGLDD